MIAESSSSVVRRVSGVVRRADNQQVRESASQVPEQVQQRATSKTINTIAPPSTSTAQKQSTA